MTEEHIERTLWLTPDTSMSLDYDPAPEYASREIKQVYAVVEHGDGQHIYFPMHGVSEVRPNGWERFPTGVLVGAVLASMIASAAAFFAQ